VPGIGLGLSPAFGAADLRIPPLLRVYAIGDSVVQGTIGTTGIWDNTKLPAYGESYILRTVYKNGDRAMIVVNGGVQGNTTGQMLARFDTDIGAHIVPGGGICLISGGGNDINGGVAQATIVDNVRHMAVKARGYGLIPIVVLPTPYDNNPPNNRAAWVSYIAALEAMAAAEGYRTWDIFRVFSVAGDGAWTDAGDTYDTVHLTRAGELKAANYASQQLQSLLSPKTVSQVAKTVGALEEGSILNTTGCFDGSTHAGTGAPTGWNSGATASGTNGGVRSFVDDDYSNGLRHRVSKTGAGNFNILRQLVTTKLTPLIGEPVLFTCRYWCKNMYESASAFYKLNFAIALGGTPALASPARPLNQAPWETGDEGEVVSFWMPVPSGFTSAEVQATITVTGTPVGTALIDIADVNFIPLSALV